MVIPDLAEPHVTDEALLRQLGRRPAEPHLPESHTWQVYCELRRRGNEQADRRFVETVRQLHRRRTMAGSTLPTVDANPAEHKMVDDPVLAELWRAYKRCICNQRTGPAAQLLRDIEAQLSLS
jgi:hypothetical protein